MTVCLVYITAESRDQAVEIGQALVDERSCRLRQRLRPDHLDLPVGGAVQEGEEYVLIAKTRDSLVDRLAKTGRGTAQL